MEQRNSRLFLLLIYFSLAIYLLPMFPGGGSPDELSHWATAAALVERNSFDISQTEELIGRNDESVRIGYNVYSNNAPGTAVFAAPAYAIARIFIGPPDTENIGLSWLAMRLLTSTLPLFFLAIWLYQKDVDLLSLATLLFATPLFVNSFLLHSHLLVAVLIYLVFRLLFDARKPALRNVLFAGFLSGYSILCEFSAAIPVLIFTFGLLFTDLRDRYRRLFFYAVGIVPSLILLLIYNNFVFGSPLSMPYGLESVSDWSVFAGRDPSANGTSILSNIFLQLVSPSRGLFFFSPILFFSIIAIFSSREQGTLRKRIKLITIFASILILCGLGAKSSVGTFGSGELVFIIPLLLDSFFDGEIEDFPSLWRGFLFGLSFVLCTLPVLTFPFAPAEFDFPHNNFWRPLLAETHWFTPNLLNFAGVPSTIWSTSPAIAVLLLAAFLVWRNAKYPVIFLVGLGSAFIAVGIYVFSPGLDNDQSRSRRNAVVERLSKPNGGTETLPRPK